MPGPTASPPTRRVITIVDLLAEAEKPLSTTEVARRLNIARATATAVLTELEAAGWVQRDGELNYALGPTLGRIGSTGRAQPTLLAGGVLADLARTTRCGVTLSHIGPDHFTVVDKKHGGDRVIPGLPTGQKLPREFPVGAAVMPWRPRPDREKWLSGSTQHAALGEALLRSVRKFGFAIFRPSDNDAGLVEVLADLLGAVGAEIHNPAIRTRAIRQLGALTSRAYTDAEIRSQKSLPISYLTAPVFDQPDHAGYEVQLGPLRAEVSKPERDAYVAALLSSAGQLSEVLQGH